MGVGWQTRRHFQHRGWVGRSYKIILWAQHCHLSPQNQIIDFKCILKKYSIFLILALHILAPILFHIVALLCKLFSGAPQPTSKWQVSLANSKININTQHISINQSGPTQSTQFILTSGRHHFSIFQIKQNENLHFVWVCMGISSSSVIRGALSS